MKLSKSYLVFEAQVARRDWDLALGRLFQLGITSSEQRRRRGRLGLTAQLPPQIQAKLLPELRRWEKSQIGRRVFHEAKLRRITTGAWSRKYQKHLRPFFLFAANAKHGSLTVDPRGRLPKRLRSDILYIESGLAFGTGTHQTTQLAAEFLAQSLASLVKPSVLDVGCGTGILAMAAKRLGAGRVDAVDNDPEAIQTARHNLAANRIRGVGLRHSLAPLRGKYSVIVSNITLNTLVELRPALLQRLAPGGILILTGLLYRDCAELLRVYRGLQLLERRNRGGWAALRLKK